MFELAKEAFLPILLDMLNAAILGVGVRACLFELLDGMGINIRRDRKVKCWIYTSVLIFIFLVMLRIQR